jgi:hypothetical protein
MACLLLSTTAWSGKAVADKQAFKEHCGQCHERAASLARNLKGSTIKERGAIFLTIALARFRMMLARAQ